MKSLKKIILALSLTLCLILALCCCDSAENKESNTESATESESITDTSAAPESDSESKSESESVTESETEAQATGYTITVVDENGAPMAGVNIQICNGSLCLPPYYTDANGIVWIAGDISAYSVKATLDGYTSEEEEYTFESGSAEIEIVMTAN